MLRRLLDIGMTQNSHSSSDTIATNVPRSSGTGRPPHTSTTSLFVIYMAIGFSVTFACILIIMTAYHWVRRSMPVLAHGSRLTSRRNSSRTRQPQHEPKQLFVVQHPGGHANLAFREHEDLQPYKKKTAISVFSADLDDDSFTIPAIRSDATSETWAAPNSMSAMQLDSHDRPHGLQMESDVYKTTVNADRKLQQQEGMQVRASVTPLPALQPTLAHTASQTSPRHCKDGG